MAAQCLETLRHSFGRAETAYRKKGNGEKVTEKWETEKNGNQI